MKSKNFFYSHICAVAENNTIGLKGDLPWNIPEDLKFFKEKTKGKVLIMGRKTFESLGKPLPHRLNLVITRQKNFVTGLKCLFTVTEAINCISELDNNSTNWIKKLSKGIVCPSLSSVGDFCAQEKILKTYGKEIFIIGGGEVYQQSLPLVKRIYLTRIHKEYPGDAFYPEIPEQKFKEIERKKREGNPSYSFITYERI